MKPRTRFGACSYKDSGDSDRRVLAAGILTHIEGADRLQPGDDYDQIDHEGQDRTSYKEIGDFHGRSVQLFRGWAPS